jgi:hypothetical protein
MDSGVLAQEAPSWTTKSYRSLENDGKWNRFGVELLR